MFKRLSCTLLISLGFFLQAYSAGMVCTKPTMGGFSPLSFSFTCTNTELKAIYKGGYTVSPYNPPAGTSFSISTGACESPARQISPGQSCTVTGTFTAPRGAYSIDFSDRYGGETHNGIFESYAGGPVTAQVISWHNYHQNGPGTSPQGVFVDSHKVIYVATGNSGGGLAVSHDGGTTWTNYTISNGLPSNVVTAVYVDGNNIYAGTQRGLAVSTNGGSSWTPYSQFNNRQIVGIYASGENIYVIQQGAGLIISTNGGSTWSSNYLQFDSPQGVYGFGSTVYVATRDGVYIGPNDGSNWVQSTSGLGSNTVQGVYISSDGQTLYAATQGGLSISTDGGSSWTNYTTGLASSNVQAVYASGSTIYAATDAGLSVGAISNNSWAGTNYLTSNSVSSVTANGANIYAATDTDLAISTNDGTAWTHITITDQGLGGNEVNGVYASGANIYVALRDNGLSVSHDSGQHWTTYTTADGLAGNDIYGVYAVGSTIYAAINGQGVSINRNNGNGDWTTALAGLTAQGVFASGSNVFVATYDSGNGEIEISPNSGENWTQSFYLSNAYFLGIYFNGTNLYASTQGAGLYLGTPNGNSWNWNNSISTGLPYNGVGPEVYASSDGSHIYVPVGNNNGLYVSTDSGSSWQPLTTGLASNNVVGVYVSNGKIYVATNNTSNGGLSISPDDGQTWTNYTTANGLSSNAVNWVYVDGLNIYVATENGLSVAQ